MVTLFAGGQYHLYTYKKYTDIRIVFAPEKAIAFFGGDPDNFEYPRYDLDVCFMRVYEDGKPVACQEHHLSWSDERQQRERVGVRQRPPGAHRRGRTASPNWSTCRDTGYPALASAVEPARSAHRRVDRAQRQQTGKRARTTLFGIQNSRKARIGGLAGLLDPQADGPQGRRGASACSKSSSPAAR